MQKNNKTKIDKLKSLQDEQSKVDKLQQQIDDIPSFGDIAKIIKLNEELTAENNRLLTELEGITSDKNAAECNYNICHNKLEEFMEVNRIYT